MTRHSLQPDADTVERLIFQVRGIQAARVVTDAHGDIDKIHVVGLPGRSAKQIVRDIESIVFVQGGIKLDHRKISLVQVANGVMQDNEARLQLLDVAYEPERPGTPITVTLGLYERHVRGVSLGYIGDEHGPLPLAAWATTHAITQFVGKEIKLRVMQVTEHTLGNLDTCLSQVNLDWARGNETLLGISLLGADPATAAARSVLDALNRPLARILVR